MTERRPFTPGIIDQKPRTTKVTPPPAPPHLAVGYGPPGATAGAVRTAQLATSLGLGISLGAVWGRADVISYDLSISAQKWWQLGAVALLIGAGIGWLANRTAEVGTAIAPPIAVISLIAAASWIALFNIGEPDAVKALLLLAIGASIPHFFSIRADISHLGGKRAGHPTALDALGANGAALSVGIGVGSVVLFVDPSIPWATASAVGGATAFYGAWRRASLPVTLFSHHLQGRSGDADLDPAGPDPTRSSGPTRASSASVIGVAILGACSGVIVGTIPRASELLATEWEAGERYVLLSVSTAGAAGAAIGAAVTWWYRARARNHGSASIRRAEVDAARLATIAGASLLFAAVSYTLIGTIAAVAIAGGAAIAAIVLGTSVSPAALTAASAGFIAVTLFWTDIAETVGSQRWMLALAGVGAAAFGAMSSAEPRTVQPNANVPAADGSTDAAPTAPQSTTSLGAHATGFDTVPLLEASGIEFSYGPVQALFGVDLDVQPGEISAIVGANGAGKTTFLRIVAGLEIQSAGTLRFGGQDLSAFSASDRVLLGINQIAAGGAVAGDLSVADNLHMFGHTLDRSHAKAGIQRTLEVFPHFAERMGQRASSLSGGERQMLALSKSLVLRPRLLIVDELSLGLAPIVVTTLIPVIRRLHAEGAAVLLVEQSVSVALELADTAACMEKGEIVYADTADALRSDPGLLEAAYLEGISAALEQRGLAS